VKAVGLTLVVTLVLGGCHPTAQRGRGTDTVSVTGATRQVADSRSAHDTAPRIERPRRTPAIGGESGAAKLPVVQPGSEPDQAAMLREILASSALVGRRVHVTGRCLGYSNPLAVGGPPRTRSDWQLEVDGVAIYVTGPLPEGCTATKSSNELTTIVALVAEDTLPARGNRPATPRRYLVRLLP